MTINMRIAVMAVLVAAVAAAIIPVIAIDAAVQVPYFAKISIIDYDRTSYADYDLIMTDVRFTGEGWGMSPNGIWSIWDLDGSQIEEASYKTVIETINSTKLDDLKSHYCAKDSRAGISNYNFGIVKLCFIVSKDFDPDVVSFRAGVGWQITPLRDPSIACESYSDFCHKAGAYVISERQPKPEPEPGTIELSNAVYNVGNGELVIFWSDPVTLYSAEDMLLTDNGMVDISLDDYTYDMVKTVMWFEFSDSVIAQIGEANRLNMIITNDTFRGYNGTKVIESVAEVTIIN